MFRSSPLLRKILGDLVEIQIVVDAEKIQRELRWRLRRRRSLNARSAFHEVIESGFYVPLVPRHLHSEIEEHLSEIAAQTGATVAQAQAEWENVQKLLNVYEPRVRASASQNPIDPDDVPYKYVSEDLGIPVYSSDRHLKRMNVPVITICLDIAARDYVRSASITLAGLAGTATTVTVAVGGLVAFWNLTKALFERVLQLPKPVQALLVGALATALIHPKSRATLLSWVRAGYQGAAKLKPEALNMLARGVQELGTAMRTLQKRGQEIRSALPTRKKRSALMHLRGIIAASKQPMSLTELELQVKQQGYVSRSRNLRAYIRRVLRNSGQFHEVKPGTWTFQPQPIPRTN